MKVSHRTDEARISDLEDRFSRLEARVRSLEDSSPLVQALDEQADDSPQGIGIGTEYWIGARFLPRLGAVLIILAIAFIAISESSKNASVDRSVLLAFEALLCFGFIAVGEWRRDALEGFGRTLSAVGACGLYLTAAGGHFAYHTLTAAGMAAGFALLTILNHTYAVLRNTRLFFFIGATGGLAAMLFPLVEQDYGTALAVYVTVTLAAAVVCATRKWQLLAFVGWLLGLAILTPVIDSQYPRWTVLAALYLGSLACIGAYVRSHKGDSYNIAAVGAGLMFLATGLVGFGVVRGLPGIAQLILFGGLGTAMALSSQRGNKAARSLLVGSWVTSALLVPLCLPIHLSVMAFVAIGGLALMAGERLGRSMAAVFSVGAFLASIFAYVGWAFGGAPFSEHVLLAILLVAIALTAGSLKLAQIGWVSFSIASLWALLVRWSIVLSPSVVVQPHSFSLLTSVTILYALVLLVLGFRLKSGKLRMWSIAVMLAGVFQILVLESATAIAFRLSALLFLGGMMLVGGYTYVRDRKWESPDEQSADPT